MNVTVSFQARTLLTIPPAIQPMRLMIVLSMISITGSQSLMVRMYLMTRMVTCCPMVTLNTSMILQID